MSSFSRALASTLRGLLLALCLAGPSAVQAGPYNFVSIDAGGTGQTLLYGISNNGVTAGYALDPNNNYYATGLVLNSSGSTPVTAPGAVDTELYQVNDAGQVAVSYYGPDGIYHAATFDSVNSSWTNLPDVAGYAENLAGGINNHGVVVGDSFLNSGFAGGLGWTRDGNGYSFFSAPGSDPTQLGTATYSINDSGQIVGYFQDSTGAVHGYLKAGSDFTTLDAPGAAGYTSAQGISNLGTVTGYYIDASGAYHGYLWNSGQFATLDVPFAGATNTDITAIDDRGDLVGWYTDADGNFHGFEAFSVPEPAAIIPMATGLLGLGMYLRRSRRTLP